MRAVMMTVGVCRAIVGDAEARIYAEAHEAAARPQIHERIAVRIAREWMDAADITAGIVDLGPLLPQVEECDRYARVVLLQLGESALAPESGEVAALQGRIRHVDAPVARERPQRGVDKHAHKGRMGEEHVTALGIAEFVLYPIGLDDYSHAGLDPPAQRIGGVEAEKAKQIAHAGLHRAVVRRGPDDGG